jgi:hypothetical protein
LDDYLLRHSAAEFEKLARLPIDVEPDLEDVVEALSDHYKHISERAARKASDALSRVKAEQRAEARAKMQERARGIIDLVHSDAIPTLTDIGSGQSAVVH